MVGALSVKSPLVLPVRPPNPRTPRSTSGSGWYIGISPCKKLTWSARGTRNLPSTPPFNNEGVERWIHRVLFRGWARAKADLEPTFL